MIAALFSLSIRWRGVVILATVIGALLGARAYQTLSIDAVPDLTNVQVQILSNAPGLAPLETENLIARPVELAMAGIPGVEGIRSLSRAGVAAVTVRDRPVACRLHGCPRRSRTVTVRASSTTPVTLSTVASQEMPSAASSRSRALTRTCDPTDTS